MKILRRLYGYLRHYKTWAIIAFGSMIVFALTQTVLAALVRPLIDDVLSPPRVQRTVGANDRTTIVERALAQYAPPSCAPSSASNTGGAAIRPRSGGAC